MESQNYLKGSIFLIWSPLIVLLNSLHNHTSLPILIYGSHPEVSDLSILFYIYGVLFYNSQLQHIFSPRYLKFPLSNSPSGKHLLIVQPSLIITSSVKPFSIRTCKCMDTAPVSKKHHMHTSISALTAVTV